MAALPSASQAAVQSAISGYNLHDADCLEVGVVIPDTREIFEYVDFETNTLRIPCDSSKQNARIKLVRDQSRGSREERADDDYHVIRFGHGPEWIKKSKLKLFSSRPTTITCGGRPVKFKIGHTGQICGSCTTPDCEVAFIWKDNEIRAACGRRLPHRPTYWGDSWQQVNGFRQVRGGSSF
jgi:hypothetical protein